MGESARKFGRYEALFRIASGGMAEVFAGRVRGEGGFEKLVAIKRMLPHLADDPEFVSMFLDEARVAANVSSAHVVSTLDIGRTEDGALFIVMDLVLGLSLSELRAVARKRRVPMPPEVCVDILAQAAQGLHDAHEARTAGGQLLGLVHRDVSPQNLLIGAEGRTRLTDFGIAHATQARMTETEHGKVKGKFAYFSPEQSRGEILDRRSDVFALGVVGWEMLAGCRLFARDTPINTIGAVRSGPIPSLDQVREDIDPTLAKAIDRALKRPVDERYETARDMAEALRGVYGTGALGEVEGYVKALRPERIVQLEARIREAVGSPDIRTLPDIDVEAPSLEEPDVTQLPTMAITFADKPKADVPTMILDVETEARVLPTEEPKPPRRGWVVVATAAIVTVALVGIVAASLSASPDDPPAAPAAPMPAAQSPPTASQSAETAPVVAAAPPEEDVASTTEIENEDPPPIAQPAAPATGMRQRRGSARMTRTTETAEAPPAMDSTGMVRVRTGRAAGLDLFDNASSMRR